MHVVLDHLVPRRGEVALDALLEPLDHRGVAAARVRDEDRLGLEHLGDDLVLHPRH